MKDIRIDNQGRQRCWHCGGTNFNLKRTVRSKMVVGVGAMATKKKLKCLSCGEFNDVGSAKPYTGPKSKRAAKKSGALAMDERDANLAGTEAVTAQAMQAIVNAAPAPQSVAPPPPPAIGSAVADDSLTPPPPGTPAGWVPDPSGRYEMRYWDGSSWTEHVATGATQGVDPAVR